MVLIADSGSTKAHWCLMAANGHTSEFYTEGVNPLFQTVDEMEGILSDKLLPQMAKHLWAGTITNVFFYGAGCIPTKIYSVKEAIGRVFRKAEVYVASDMVGAARGLLGRQRGVACILGTGSNSCLYDGQEIEWGVPALGFILGDEGSGAVLGRRLVSDLLKNQLGEDLKERFLKQYQLTQADIIEHVYRMPMPNRWLAGVSRFCAENIADPRIHELVYQHFCAFIERNVLQYYADDSEKEILPVSFVGSIAYFYRAILEKAMRDHRLGIGEIMQDPIQGLIAYHKADAVPTQI